VYDALRLHRFYPIGTERRGIDVFLEWLAATVPTGRTSDPRRRDARVRTDLDAARQSQNRDLVDLPLITDPEVLDTLTSSRMPLRRPSSSMSTSHHSLSAAW